MQITILIGFYMFEENIPYPSVEDALLHRPVQNRFANHLRIRLPVDEMTSYLDIFDGFRYSSKNSTSDTK